MPKYQRPLPLFVLTSLLMIGCGPSGGARVSGTALLQDGTPLVGARVTARSPETGKWASGTTDQQGNFVLGTEHVGEPLPLGDYAVFVTEDLGDWDHPQPPKIARKYGSAEQSGLNLSITDAGDARLDLKLDPAL